MSRVARIVVPGIPHHVVQRGNRRMDVFHNDDDRRTYLHLLHEYSERSGLAIWAYCLMTNHVHLVVVPEREESLANALRGAHTAYALRFNMQTEQTGHVWQGRFYSCPLDESHLWAAVRYVERNPVRAGMTAHAADFYWSSARANCGIKKDPLLAEDFPPEGAIDDWTEWLRSEDDREVTAIRVNTRTGRPCGTHEFAKRIEGILGRAVLPKKRGRKSRVET